jgi:hypothetical protein
MAVGVQMDFTDGTLDQYEQVIELMGLPHNGPGPEGALFHWVTQTDDGIRVVDVWESQEQFDRFAQEQIGPFSQQAGITEPPETTYRDVHNNLPHN